MFKITSLFLCLWCLAMPLAMAAEKGVVKDVKLTSKGAEDVAKGIKAATDAGALDGIFNPKTLKFSVRGDLKLLNGSIEDEASREAANQSKVVTNPSLKIIADLLLDKSEIWHLPKNYKKNTIEGKATCSKDQAIALLERYNYELPIGVTPREIVELYKEEATMEGIKWDIAFCQALVETGFFTFGGTVVPEQNNFCGLGTTSATVRGAYFLTAREGVRAHIQHLKAYCSPELPKTEIIDPRFDLVYKPKKATNSFFKYWSELNGKWATGSDYAEKILNLHQQMEKIVAVHGEEERNIF